MERSPKRYWASRTLYPTDRIRPSAWHCSDRREQKRVPQFESFGKNPEGNFRQWESYRVTAANRSICGEMSEIGSADQGVPNPHDAESIVVGFHQPSLFELNMTQFMWKGSMKAVLALMLLNLFTIQACAAKPATLPPTHPPQQSECPEKGDIVTFRNVVEVYASMAASVTISDITKGEFETTPQFELTRVGKRPRHGGP